MNKVEQVVDKAFMDDKQQESNSTILLIDDTHEILTLMKETLKLKNYNVFDTQFPEEAIEMCKLLDVPIDLLIVDLVMPEMYGQDLTQQLRHIHPEMKVLFISGYSPDAANLEEDVPFLKKPFSPITLIGKVEELLAS